MKERDLKINSLCEAVDLLSLEFKDFLIDFKDIKYIVGQIKDEVSDIKNNVVNLTVESNKLICETENIQRNTNKIIDDCDLIKSQMYDKLAELYKKVEDVPVKETTLKRTPSLKIPATRKKSITETK